MVLRAGQKGARIYPKGCQVRNCIVDGQKRKVSKAGKLKPVKKKVKVTDRVYYVHVMAPDGSALKFTWDTGADITLMNLSTAKKMKLIGADGKPLQHFIDEKRVFNASAINASNKSEKGLAFKDVPLTLRETKHASRGTVMVTRHGKLLLGTPHMRGQRKHLRVKFK